MGADVHVGGEGGGEGGGQALQDPRHGGGQRAVLHRQLEGHVDVDVVAGEGDPGPGIADREFVS